MEDLRCSVLHRGVQWEAAVLRRHVGIRASGEERGHGGCGWLHRGDLNRCPAEAALGQEARTGFDEDCHRVAFTGEARPHARNRFLDAVLAFDGPSELLAECSVVKRREAAVDVIPGFRYRVEPRASGDEQACDVGMGVVVPRSRDGGFVERSVALARCSVRIGSFLEELACDLRSRVSGRLAERGEAPVHPVRIRAGIEKHPHRCEVPEVSRDGERCAGVAVDVRVAF